MMKLIKTIICDTKSLTKLEREQYIIPEEYNGRVVLETWEINNSIKYKSVALNSGIRNYLLTLGDFKDVPIKEEKKDKKDIKLDYVRKKQLLNMWNKFHIITQKAMENIESAEDNDILRLELEINGYEIDIKSAVVNTPDDWINEAFGSDNKKPEEIKKPEENKKEEEFKKDIQTRGERLKDIVSDVLSMNKDSSINNVSEETIEKMRALEKKMIQYDKDFPSNNKSKNTLNQLNGFLTTLEKTYKKHGNSI